MYFFWINFFINFLQCIILILCSKSRYKGENFPIKYLESDFTIPSHRDFDYFLAKLKKTAYYNTRQPNNTDCNIAIGTYLMTCILRRAMIDDGSKMTKTQYETVGDLINRGKTYISHYIYNNKPYGYADMEFKVSLLYKDVDIFARSMNDIEEKRLTKWILSDLEMHEFVKSIDKATLEKEMFIYVVESMDKYRMNMTESDVCLSRIMENPVPIDTVQMQPCRRDEYCKQCLLSGPSIAYALTHRLLNMVFRRNVRRCYLQSVEEDQEMHDQLCAFMYREAVYLARRGFFARDLFLEHVALCAIMGYREFHRIHWFYKATSWMDEAGCMQENPNYDINRTKLYKSLTNSTKKKKMYTKTLKKTLLDDCHSHPMTLLTVVLAHAVRYVAHFI